MVNLIISLPVRKCSTWTVFDNKQPAISQAKPSETYAKMG
jgi:hypothetical protein